MDFFSAATILFLGVIVMYFFSLNQKEKKNLMKKGPFASMSFEAIKDKYHDVNAVQRALRLSGLESSNLIIGIDFTKSNEWQGERTFNGRSLHHLISKSQKGHPVYNKLNPYQTAIDIIGRTLSAFDDDGEIAAFGFGDSKTEDKAVFPLSPNPLMGFEKVLEAYTQTCANVVLSGPTSFVPLIDRAIQITVETGRYHILLIVADGMVTNKQENINAIVRASKHPLSIVMIGVGDGLWDVMNDFDDLLPQRQFDNFQFVDLDDVMRRCEGNEAVFATCALQEIPDQFNALRELGYIG